MNPNILQSIRRSSLSLAILFLFAPWRTDLAQDSHFAQTAVRPQPPVAKIEPVTIQMHGVGYSRAHWQDRYFILTNADGATNGNVFWTFESQTEPERWHEFLPHRAAVEITGFDEFRDFAVVHERQDGLEKIRILNMSGNESRYIDFPEPAYRFVAGDNPDYGSHEYRITYESLVTPWSIYDCDLRTGDGARLPERSLSPGWVQPAVARGLRGLWCRN